MARTIKVRRQPGGGMSRGLMSARRRRMMPRLRVLLADGERWRARDCGACWKTKVPSMW